MNKDEEYAFNLIRFGDIFASHVKTIVEMDEYATDHVGPCVVEGDDGDAFLVAYDFTKRHGIVNNELKMVVETTKGADCFSALVWHQYYKKGLI